MSDPIRFTLPLPPSLNNAYGNRKDGRGRYPTKTLIQWKTEAGWLVQASEKRRIVGPYRIAISVPEKMPGDLDNRPKAILDLLVEHGVTPDDRFAYSVAVSRSPDVKAGDCLVEVSPA